MYAVEIQGLCKTYNIHEREAGIIAAAKSLFKRHVREVKAVDHISFNVTPGEIVGFLGPNGAGKTTTLKMLSGLLHPTDGYLVVLGHIPWKRESSFLRQITLVMGNRNQLLWDIPAIDTFELNRAIYRIPSQQYRQTLDELIDLLELETILRKPVRNLSLGERMKCEIACALLHRPQVLFLDEPTIGLDVTMQRRIRAFLKEYNRRHHATILLTSHYMADVEALCERVVVIHHGIILFDGALRHLIQRFSPHKTLMVKMGNGAVDLGGYGEVMSRQDEQVTLRIPKSEVAQVTSRLLADFPITDLTVEDPTIEEVIEQVFSQPGVS